MLTSEVKNNNIVRQLKIYQLTLIGSTEICVMFNMLNNIFNRLSIEYADKYRVLLYFRKNVSPAELIAKVDRINGILRISKTVYCTPLMDDGYRINEIVDITKYMFKLKYNINIDNYVVEFVYGDNIY
jgi:hypothetical protein